MRKLFTVLVIVGVAMCLATAGWAGTLYPKAVGDDAVVPNLLIKAIPSLDKSPVYAACDANGWLVNSAAVSDEIKKATQMSNNGDGWVAFGLVGHRFHPVQLDKEGKPKWAKIESVYPLNSKFVDTSTGSPCLLVK